MSTTAPKPATTPIPVQLSEPEFEPTFKGLWQRMENFSVTTAVSKA